MSHATRVPLLPKLRGNFAEFLSESYLAHLSILYLPTFGGLGYGYLLFSIAKFFLAVWSQHLRARKLYTSRLTLLRLSGFSYSNLLHACTSTSSRLRVYPPASLRIWYRIIGSSGIST